MLNCKGGQMPNAASMEWVFSLSLTLLIYFEVLAHVHLRDEDPSIISMPTLHLPPVFVFTLLWAYMFSKTHVWVLQHHINPQIRILRKNARLSNDQESEFNEFFFFQFFLIRTVHILSPQLTLPFWKLSSKKQKEAVRERLDKHNNITGISNILLIKHLKSTVARAICQYFEKCQFYC